MATTKTVTLPISGTEITIKRLQKRDLVDVQEVWPIFHAAVLGILKASEDPKAKAKAENIEKGLSELAERSAEVTTALLSRGCTPAIWDTESLGELPSGAVNMREFTELDLEHAVGQLTTFMSGMDVFAERLHATTVMAMARRTGTRVSELLGITGEWEAFAWDMALETWARIETSRRIAKATGGEGSVFPAVDVAAQLEV